MPFSSWTMNFWLSSAYLDLVLGQVVLVGPQELLEVLLHELEDQVELLLGRLVDHVQQRDDRRVVQLFEDRDLSHRRRRHALLLVLEPDLLQRDDLVRHRVARLVHHAVGAFAQLVQLLVALFGIQSRVLAHHLGNLNFECHFWRLV